MDTKTLEAAQRYQARLAKRKARRANRRKSASHKLAMERRIEAADIRLVSTGEAATYKL